MFGRDLDVTVNISQASKEKNSLPLSERRRKKHGAMPQDGLPTGRSNRKTNALLSVATDYIWQL